MAKYCMKSSMAVSGLYQLLSRRAFSRGMLSGTECAKKPPCHCLFLDVPMLISLTETCWLLSTEGSEVA